MRLALVILCLFPATACAQSGHPVTGDLVDLFDQVCVDGDMNRDVLERRASSEQWQKLEARGGGDPITWAAGFATPHGGDILMIHRSETARLPEGAGPPEAQGAPAYLPALTTCGVRGGVDADPLARAEAIADTLGLVLMERPPGRGQPDGLIQRMWGSPGEQVLRVAFQPDSRRMELELTAFH